MSDTAGLPTLGVIIVTYRSSDVVLPCLESLLNSHYPHIKIVVCDNASPDDTVGAIRGWARRVAEVEPPVERQSAQSGALPRRIRFRECTASDGEPGISGELSTVTLVHSGLNRGYAGGVNVGLKVLRRYPEIELFWILNPDCVVMPEAATAFVATARKNPGFGLMGGRVKYFGQEQQIQSDGGRVHPWTGICASIGLGQPAEGTLPPDPSQIQFVSGASLVASREFLARAGLMVEDYFLYYEEVDWALRRGDLPIVYAEGAVVCHRVGTSIGSATLKSAPSAFANYFNYRNRIRFIRRFFPSHLPVA
jgi:GT2 family glycosyltransferase